MFLYSVLVDHGLQCKVTFTDALHVWPLPIYWRFYSILVDDSSSRSSRDRLLGPLPAKCWPEALVAVYNRNFQPHSLGTIDRRFTDAVHFFTTNNFPTFLYSILVDHLL